MTRIDSERLALSYFTRLNDSVAILDRDGDMAAFHARQRELWDAIEAHGHATTQRVKDLIMAQMTQRRVA